MKIVNDPIKATSGRDVRMPVIRSQKSTESANTPANTATEAEIATAGRGNFFSQYKTPLIIGGLALAAIFIFTMNRKKPK